MPNSENREECFVATKFQNDKDTSLINLPSTKITKNQVEDENIINNDCISTNGNEKIESVIVNSNVNDNLILGPQLIYEK